MQVGTKGTPHIQSRSRSSIESRLQLGMSSFVKGKKSWVGRGGAVPGGSGAANRTGSSRSRKRKLPIRRPYAVALLELLTACVPAIDRRPIQPVRVLDHVCVQRASCPRYPSVTLAAKVSPRSRSRYTVHVHLRYAHRVRSKLLERPSTTTERSITCIRVHKCTNES